MSFKFQKAKRENIWLKLMIAGVAGCGKTYSALRVATGIVKKTGGKIAAIDTENGRIRFYANEFDFSDITLQAPYEPERYIEAIDAAVEAGFDVLIIDSLSHSWTYLNELKSKMPGTSDFAKWAKLTPRDDALQEKILQSPIHIISTVRGKTAYAMEEVNGKSVPKKVGVGLKIRESSDFQYAAVLSLDNETHIPNVEKDNTHLFEGKYDKLTEKHGEMLYDWANSGEAKLQREQDMLSFEKAKIDADANNKKEPISFVEVIDDITQLCKAKVSSGIDKNVLFDEIQKVCGTKNYNNIKDITILEKIIEAVNNVAN